jgi:hypothetical protein
MGQMQIRDFLMLCYGALGGSISGKTKLQKMAYFLSLLTDFDAGYKPHYYGPYSSDVADANLELKALGYISEKRTQYGYDHRGFERARYDYELTGDGARLLEKKKKEFASEWDQIHSCAQSINFAANTNYMTLSIAAKTYYILTRSGEKELSFDSIKKSASNLGWDVNTQEIDMAVQLLEQMKIARRCAAEVKQGQ